MAIQPTTHLRYPRRNKKLWKAYENHWFPLIRPAIKALFPEGGVRVRWPATMGVLGPKPIVSTRFNLAYYNST